MSKEEATAGDIRAAIGITSNRIGSLCWWRLTIGVPWRAGWLRFWGTDFDNVDENCFKQFPVGVIEDARTGGMYSVYVERIVFQSEEPAVDYTTTSDILRRKETEDNPEWYERTSCSGRYSRTCVCGSTAWWEMWVPKKKEENKPVLFRVKCDRCGRHTACSTSVGDVEKLWNVGFEIYLNNGDGDPSRL